QRMHQLIADGVSQWVDRAHCLVAAFWRDQVLLATIGPMHAYLVRHERLHDILGPGDRTKPNPLRLFSQVVSGQLTAGDRLLFCAPSLLDYFSIEKLRRTMIDRSPAESVRQWETTLLGVESRSSFAAVAAHIVAVDAVASIAQRPEVQATRNRNAPQASMEELIAQEAATERLLSPSIWPAVRDTASLISQALQRVFRRIVLRKPPRRSLAGTAVLTPGSPTTQPMLSRRSAGQFASWFAAVRQVFVRGARLLVQAFRPRRRSPDEAYVAAPTALRQRWSLSRTVTWFQELGRRQQLFFVVGVIAVFILAVTILQTATPTTPRVASATTISQINDAITKAQAAMLYGGEETAQQYYTSASELFSSLPNRNAKDKTARQTIQTKLDDLALALSHLTKVNDAPQIISYAATDNRFQPTQLYLLGSRLVAFDGTKAAVITSDLTGATPTVITNALDTGRPTTGASSGTNTILFGTDRDGFIEVDVVKKSWKPIDVAYPQTNPRLQAIHQYQNRLYALDTEHTAVLRFARSTSSLGTGSLWLKETASLASARSISVDGSVWILQPNGVVEEYQAGKKATFALAAANPALTNATRLWTDVTATHLYLLDPEHHRFLVYTKNGTLVDQYQSDAWTNLRDFAINEQTKTAYILNGQSVMSVTLIH
ncbi:MAG: hypothetical protein HY975_04175, partial [Candidatus Kerfeldbacteria bacterium]|nr:hypothetical protein [Candidatus Kerfeldbacteria bacterium]